MKMDRETKLEILEKLMQYLAKGPRTAMDIARELKVSKVTAYHWLHDLENRGSWLAMKYEDGSRGKTGPRALVYQLRS